MRPNLALLVIVLAPAASACSGSRAESDAGGGDAARAADDAAIALGDSSFEAGAFDAAPDAACGALGGPPREYSCIRSSSGFTTEIAFILDDPSASRVRILSNGLSAAACAQIDHIRITSPSGGTLASFDGRGLPLAQVGWGGWIEGPASTEAAAFCERTTDRFDAVRLEIIGRGAGTDFALACGGASGGFPPGLVVTCHRGVPPSLPSTLLSIDTTSSVVQGRMPSDRALAFASIDSNATVTSAAFDGFGRAEKTTQTISGWHLDYFVDDPSGPGPAPIRYAYRISARGDVLGPLCVRSGGMPPEEIPPVVLLHFTGTTDTGAFSTELYAEGCFRMRE